MKNSTLRRSLVALLVAAFAVVALPATASAQQARVPSLRAVPAKVKPTARPTMHVPQRRPAAAPATPARPGMRCPNTNLPGFTLPKWTGPAPVIPARLPAGSAPVIPAKLPNFIPVLVPAKLPAWHLPQVRAK